MSSSDSDEGKTKKTSKSKKEKRPKIESSSDSGPEDREPLKKVKKNNNGSATTVINDQGEEMLELGNMKYVTVREFKGKTLIDIREYYKDKSSGKIRPGKKGISLSVEQYTNFKKVTAEIDSKI